MYTTGLRKRQRSPTGPERICLFPFHRNAMPVPGTGSGASVLVYEDSGTAAVLAENILKNLVELGLKDQGIEERPGLVVLRKTQMPAVLAEVGFIDNPSDNAFLDRNFDAIARAIADGILTTLREQKEQTPLYYQVQTGAFRDRGRAMRLAGELQSAGFPAFIVYDEGLYKVRVGAFLDMENGIRMEQNVKRAGSPAYLVREARSLKKRVPAVGYYTVGILFCSL